MADVLTYARRAYASLLWPETPPSLIRHLPWDFDQPSQVWPFDTPRDLYRAVKLQHCTFTSDRTAFVHGFAACSSMVIDIEVIGAGSRLSFEADI